MKETPQEYTRRILGYLEGKKAIEVLAATPRRLARLVKGVSKRTLSRRLTRNEWSVTEVLAHMADAELVAGFRMRLVLGANGTTIQAFDQDAWARFSDYAKQDPAVSLEAFRATRERLLRLLKGLPRSSWELHGVHSERGRETVARMAEMLAGHDVNHVKQIEQRLAAR